LSEFVFTYRQTETEAFRRRRRWLTAASTIDWSTAPTHRSLTSDILLR